MQEASDDDPDRKREKTLFETVLRNGKIENKYAREYGASIYALINANTSISAIFQKEIAERKKEQ